MSPDAAPPEHSSGSPVQALGGEGVVWVSSEGEGVRAHAPQGSEAAALMPRELQEADRIVTALKELLQPPPEQGATPVDVYLVDPLPDVPAFLSPGAGDGSGATQPSEVGSGGIVRVVRPKAGGDSMALPLARLLIPRWFGSQAASAPSFIEGVAGVVAARTATGPPVAQADDQVRADLAAGRQVSVLAPPGVAGAGPATAPAAAVTSFVAYLVDQFGSRSLGRFLGQFDPQRRDEAGLAVYQRPLPALVEAWLGGLRRQRRGPLEAGSLRYLLALLRPHRLRHAEILAYQLVGALTAVTLPLASGCVIRALGPPGQSGDGFCDAVAPPPLTAGRLGWIILALAIVYVIDNLVAFRRVGVETELFMRVTNELRERMFARLNRLSQRYYARANTGDIISRLTQDTQMLQSSLTELFSTASLMTLTAVAAVATAILKSPYVGALVLVIIPGFMLANRLFGRRFANAMLRVQEVNGEVMAVSQESLSAQGVVKAYGLEERTEGSYRGRLRALADASIGAARIRQSLDTTVNMAVVIGQLLVVGVGGFLVLNRIGDTGTVTTLLVLLPAIMVRASLVINLQSRVRAGSGSLLRIRELLDEPVDIEDKPGAIELPPLSREIRLENVTFGYGGGRPVLKDLDLTIPAGKSVGLVGASGSGKSTIINLLVRFWDPEQGRVTFDGHDLRDVTLRSLRDQIGLVFQEAFVFNSTVRDNIAMGRLDATDAEIEAAARAAELEEFVASLPAGYDTVLGERGVRMSGGQRQRLAIARALLRNPRLLILDEPTSALDARTEAEILKTLEAASRGRTTVTITHRLSLAVAADFVVVLDQGRIVEQGTHAELVDAGGLYQRLWQEQTGGAPAEPAAQGPEARAPAGLDATRLASIPLFSRLSSQDVAGLARLLARERYAAGQEVVAQGDPADKLLVVAHGEADVLVNDGGGERLVDRLNEGEYFGETTVLTQEAQTATVRATTPLEVYTLSGSDLLTFLEQRPQVRAAISQFLADRRAAFAGAEQAAGVHAERPPT